MRVALHPFMILLALQITILAAIPQPQPRVTGGTGPERAALEAMLAKVPACLRGADGKPVDVTIAGGNGNDPATRESRGEVNAQYLETHGRTPRHVEVNQALFEPFYSRAVREAAQGGCASEATMREAMNPVAMLTHEFAHFYHLGGTYTDSQGHVRSNRSLIDEFLAIKWRAARRTALNDPDVRRLMKQIHEMEMMRPPRGPNAAREAAERAAKYCAAVDALDRKMSRYGFPVRFPGDGPYTMSDPDGAEYFAVAMETLIYHPEVFAKAYSPAEQAWLAAHMGECIATFPKRAPSYEATSRALQLQPSGHMDAPVGTQR